MNDTSTSGRVAVATGACSGIGEATPRALAADGSATELPHHLTHAETRERQL
jgi:NADP-dependent 3-hydroxy acid dehydrogenase YdfG